MKFHVKRKRSFGGYSFLLIIICLLLCGSSFSQPANDSCTNASAVNISNSGFGLGIFSSTVYDISSATTQPGETFAPAILVAVQTQKSIWYKFTLPTTRAVRVTLAQTGTAITSGDVGFAVYKTNTCLPTVANISTKLTPIGVFGSTYHPCVESGDYLVQVSAKSGANGTVYIQVETDTTVAAYDRPAQAYDFGTLAQGVKTITYGVDCQSTEDATEVCTALSNYQQYNKSTWHVFKTAAYFDYIAFFLSNQNYSGTQKFGYKLYQGDVRITPFSLLPLVDGCDTLLTTYYAARKYYKCEDLNPNTTYSIEIFFHQNFNDNVQVTLATTGTNATLAPEPILSNIPPSNSLGVLPSSPAGITTTATDYHACNSRHSIHPCNPSLPAAGVTYNNVSYNGYKFNLSTFFRFTLSSTSNLTISADQYYYNQPLLLRLYKQDVSNSCNTLDTTNIISQFIYSNSNLTCLDPGNYTLQVLGRDSLEPYWYSYSYGYFGNTATPINHLTDLGQKFTLNITVKTTIAINKYSLNVPGAFDTLRAVSGVMQPLVNGVQYISKIDTFGCANTVLPWDTTCATGNTKAMYREFAVADSGIVFLTNPYPYLWNKLYLGDANALANAQNVHSYPSRINGLTPYTECLRYNYGCPDARVCLLPGTYTYITFGDSTDIGLTNQPQIRFNMINTTHNSPATAEDMGNILSLLPPTGGTVQSSIDYFSCRDNAITINGYQPCTISGVMATKAIYRQFYLSSPANVSISGLYGCDYVGGYKTLFSGKATDGIAGLTALPTPWQCFQNIYSQYTCNNLPAGWYTIISYGIGPTYANPLQSNIQNFESYVGLMNQIRIEVTIPCPGPKYNRPYKAAIDTLTNQPFLIQWAPRTGHTTAYPKTDTTYSLYRENFNCTVDTPFSSHPIPNCDASLTKVAYYVFRTTLESYMSINTKNLWGAVYAGNARTDSATFASATPIQPCLESYGHIQICRLQPGTYTLAIFATDAYYCSNVTPTIYIDQVGYSRFDHADNAYDFGTIPPDSIYHDGKIGDVNPLNAGRAPSNDFFYCTTGSRQNDPNNSAGCVIYNPNIYNTGVNNFLYSSANTPSFYVVPRRNLWYTFVVNRPGRIRVRVSNKTIGKQIPYIFSIYRSNVDGTLPFTTVVSTGQVDSTIAQGLTYITDNYYGYCRGDRDTVSFYREPCTAIPQRYYVIVDNPSTYDNTGGMHPNSQTEVSILLDSIDVSYPGDFCSDPLVASLNGPGTSTSSVTVDCHTIGTDYGEFNPTLTCPAGATTTNYKTSWFKINITGTDTLDVTTWLSENTNALPSEIKYRLMNGDCGAMQERSCVQDALTHDTYKCLPPGSYYVQVFTPVLKNGVKVTGTIDLHLSAVLRSDTCAPVNNCLSNATFIPQFDCNTSDIVTFVNYSTYGSSIQYNWDFGYNSQTSTAVAPQFFYPILSTNQTYTVSLTVQNTSCGGQSTYTVPVTIPGRSNLELGNDTTFCTPGSSLLLNATSWPGATYLWQNNSTGPTFNVTAGGINTCWVRVTYNGCIKRDTIRVRINPITRLLQTKYLCGNDSVLLNSNRGQGETHSWSTGATSSSIYAKTAGVYINTITWNGCIIRDTFNIINAVAPFANNDTTICYPFHSFTLNATTPGAIGYLWQNNSTSATFTVTAPGVFWVRVWNGTCYKRDTITVLVSTAAIIDSTNAVICSGQSYTLPGGGTAIATGIYRDTLRYSTGCDSVRRIVNLRVQTFTTVTTNPGICSGQNYTLPWGIVVSTAGIYRDTLRYTTGCDSVRRIVNLTVNATSTSSTSTTICSNQLPYNWNGTNYNAAGTYIYHTLNAVGCDSAATLNLTVNATSSSTTNITRCSNQLPFTWNGTNYNAAGIYVYHTINAVGCDSAASLNLTINNISTSVTNVTRCSNQLPFTWNGTNYNAGGSFTFTDVNAAGCDSVATLNLTINNTSTSVTNITRCSNQLPFTWNGTNYNAAGSFTFTTVNAAGCDSVATLNLTINNTSTSVTNITRCSNQLPFTWNGTNYNAAGTFVYHTLNAVGCDSAATLNLTIYNTSASVTNVTRCSNQLPFTWNGTNYNAAGIYVYHTLNAVGCDSAATLSLTINNTSASVTNVTRCSNQLPFTWNGTNYNAGGSFTFTTVNAAGCDSVATLNLTINNTSTSVANVTRCSNQLPFTWNGTNYNTAGTYVYHTLNAVGCDSAATLNLTINNTSTSVANVTRCSNQLPYTWNGTNYYAAGSFTFTTVNAAGCDSVATLNLTINNTSTSVANVSRCSNQLPFTWNGTNYNAAGSFTFTTVNAAGCDSVATLNLTINNTSTSVTNVTRCSNQLPFTWNGTNYNAAGSFMFTTVNAAGCDSAATLNLTIYNTSASVTNVTRCSNQLPFTWNSTNYNAAGSFTFTTVNAAGCDSVATLNLTINNISTSVTNVTRCSNQLPFVWNGTNYNAAGAYVYHTLNAVGCDSAATLNLIVQSPSSQTFNPIICTGQTYTLPWGITVTAAGIYMDTLHYTTGCDSLRRTINLTVQTAASVVTNPVICAGQTYMMPWGTPATASGVYRDTLHYVTGCDSVRRIVNLIVQSPASVTTNPVICQGGSYTLPWGVVVNTAGTYRDTLHYTTGCDSVRRTVNLQVTAAVVSTTNATICSDETYTLPWGAVINVAGIYKDTVQTLAGCDSLIRTVNLAVNFTPSVSLSKSNDINCMIGIANLRASGGVNYLWTPAASLNNANIYNPVASPSATTWYKVVVTSDKECTTEDSIQVKVIPGNTDNGYQVPNAFTPNGDGRNDCFGVQTWGAVTDFEFSIFSRWGERVFYSKDPKQCWDGRYKGTEQSANVFVYQIKAKGLCGDIYRKGTFVLIR